MDAVDQRQLHAGKLLASFALGDVHAYQSPQSTHNNMNQYDLKNISIEDLLNEVEEIEHSATPDRARLATISIHLLKRTGKRPVALLEEREHKYCHRASHCGCKYDSPFNS